MRYFDSKKTSLLILGITSIACSRVLFLFFNDPEGPNLLIVMGMAAIIYALSLAAYAYYPSAKRDDPKGLLPLIFIQMAIAAGFYLCLR